MAKVAIIGTGGTISSIGWGPLDLLDYPHTGQKMTVDELVENCLLYTSPSPRD